MLVYVRHVYGSHGGEREVSDPLELEVTGNCELMSAGNFDSGSPEKQQCY